MKKRTNSQIVARNRRILVAVGIFISICFAFIMYSNRAVADNIRPVYTYYTSYEIQPGDTLWTIADQFMTAESSDKAAFIDNIKSLNHIGSDNITAGKYLIIEYSSYEEL